MKKLLLIILTLPVLAYSQEKRLPQTFYNDATFFDSIWFKNLKLGTDTAGNYIVGFSKSTGSAVKIYPSLLAGGGSAVTSVAAGYGMNFTTITSTGSAIWDSAVGMTK